MQKKKEEKKIEGKKQEELPTQHQTRQEARSEEKLGAKASLGSNNRTKCAVKPRSFGSCVSCALHYCAVIFSLLSDV
jgi:hypothetical protein